MAPPSGICAPGLCCWYALSLEVGFLQQYDVRLQVASSLVFFDLLNELSPCGPGVDVDSGDCEATIEARSFDAS